MRRVGCWVLAVALSAGLGCDGVEPADGGPGGLDAGPRDAGGTRDSGRADAGPNLLGGCATDDLAACSYEPAVRADLGPRNDRPLTYVDEAGQPRSFRIEVRRPTGAVEPTPVVVWSHGGGSGRTDVMNIGVAWSEAFVRAGYTVLAIAHPGRDRASYEALCTELDHATCSSGLCGTPAECGPEETCVEGACRGWKHLSWDRPHDVREALAFLESAAASGGPLEGQVDLDRVVYAGHSAGGGSAMMVAGASRLVDGDETVLIDPRPIAFISCSPQGPGDDGFTELSFSGDVCRAMASDPSLCLGRPHLALTGVGDDTSGIVAENRRQSFDLAPATGQRHLLWVTDEAARHTTFNHEPEACESHSTANSLDPARCEVHLSWLRSAALAFLDAYAREDADAAAYLASDNLRVLSEGDAQWETR